MKKILAATRNTSLLMCMICPVFLYVNEDILSKNIFLFSIMAFIVIHLFCIFLKIKSNWFIDTIFFSCVLIIISYLPRVRINKAPIYDLNTEVGQIQQEIYEQSGVHTFYNIDVRDKAGIAYTDDYHISEDKALESLKNIREVLAFYSNGFPKEIYIINSFNSNDIKCNGIYEIKNDIIVLKQQEDISSVLHHEMGHSIENKTYNPISLLKFKTTDVSCELVSNYACTNNNELFAEVWMNTIVLNQVSEYSLAISNIFKKNIRAFNDPYYVDFNEIDDAIDKLNNGDIDSFVVKTKNNLSVGKIFMTYDMPNNIRFLDVGDKILFY